MHTFLSNMYLLTVTAFLLASIMPYVMSYLKLQEAYNKVGVTKSVKVYTLVSIMFIHIMGYLALMMYVEPFMLEYFGETSFSNLALTLTSVALFMFPAGLCQLGLSAYLAKSTKTKTTPKMYTPTSTTTTDAHTIQDVV